MNPTLIDDMGWEMAEVYASVTDQILVNLAHYFPRVQRGHVPKDVFEYQARMLAQMGQVNRETLDIIAGHLGGADSVLRDSLDAAIKEALKTEAPKLRSAAENGMLNGPGFLPPVMDARQTQAFMSYYQQAATRLNLVNTVMLESTRNAYSTTVSDIASKIKATQTIIDAAAGETIAGVSAWNEAVTNAVFKMSSNGLSGFIDHAGHRWSPEAYVAMDIRTTMHSAARAAIFEQADMFGADIYQVSTHNGARPLCYPWQAKLISRSDYERDVIDADGNSVHVYPQSATSYGQAAGLFGVNCRHYPITFIPGFSPLRGNPQEQAENDKSYALSQYQRQLERTLREARREVAILEAQGADDYEDAMITARRREQDANDALNSFCEQTGRKRKKSREYTPTNASFPPESTYDPAAFDTQTRDVMANFFEGR